MFIGKHLKSFQLDMQDISLWATDTHQQHIFVKLMMVQLVLLVMLAQLGELVLVQLVQVQLILV